MRATISVRSCRAAEPLLRCSLLLLVCCATSSLEDNAPCLVNTMRSPRTLKPVHAGRPYSAGTLAPLPLRRVAHLHKFSTDEDKDYYRLQHHGGAVRARVAGWLAGWLLAGIGPRRRYF